MDKPCEHPPDGWRLAGWLPLVVGVALGVFRCRACGERRCLGRLVA